MISEMADPLVISTISADPQRVKSAVGELGHPGDAVEMRETHISWLFLTADRAFKLKKPIVLDFLDYGAPERRRTMCEEEVRLNARLAPQLYLGVRGVADSAAGARIVDVDDPAAIDYLVEMRRYDERSTLAAAAVRGDVAPPQLAALGELLAAFHGACPPWRDRPGSEATGEQIWRNLRELRRELSAAGIAGGARARVDGLDRFLESFITGHASLLDARGEAGRIREVHGDLRAEHVILEPTLAIVDCVEFDAGLRTLDVADDLAFLVMDLCARGAEPLARRLVEEYRGAGGNCGDDELVWFYGVHRALVRVKVELVRVVQATGARAGHHLKAVDELLGVAERCAWRARGPLALVVCGVPASGKSHLAAMLGAQAGLLVLSSDVIRKELAGVAARDRAPAATYRPEFNLRTYAELGRRAAMAVGQGSLALVDATFRHRADRVAFADGFGDRAPVAFVQCLAPAAVLAQRAGARDRDLHSVSDATAEVVERERDTFEPLDEIGACAHLLTRTDRPAPAVIADLLALLDVRLASRS